MWVLFDNFCVLLKILNPGQPYLQFFLVVHISWENRGGSYEKQMVWLRQNHLYSKARLSRKRGNHAIRTLDFWQSFPDGVLFTFSSLLVVSLCAHSKEHKTEIKSQVVYKQK